MGWSGGTEIFDTACGAMIESEYDFELDAIISVLGPILESLENNDWDNLCESEYYLHPIVRQVIESLHPDYYVDEDIDS